MISFSVEVDPRPMPRPRFTRGRTYTPKEITDYKSQIKKAASKAMAGKSPMKCAVKCSIKFFRKFKPTSRRFGDADNLFKAVTDALNGVVFVDDAQIVKSSVEKFHDEMPKVEVEVAPIDD